MKPTVLIWFALSLVSACSETVDERSAWLLSSFFQTDRVLLSRDPGPVGQKYALMRSGAYAFLRGSADLFARDVSTPWSPLAPQTRFGSAATALVPIVGDPHVENAGSYLGADGKLVVDWNDFDAACYGPYHVDVWRLAVSLELIGTEVGAAAGTLARDAGLSYALTIAGPSGSGIREGATHGHFADELLKKARKRGDAGRLLNDYAPVGEDGRRRLFLADIEDPEDAYWNDTLASVSDDAASAIRALIMEAYPVAPYEQLLGSLEPMSLARRLGAGVGSYPLYRYYALFPGQTELSEDDILLELKEVRDPLALAGGALLQAKRYPSSAIRSAELQRELQLTVANDPWLSTGSALGLSFRLRHRTAYQRSFDHGDIIDAVASGDASVDDLRVLATLLGRLLADAHGRTETATGEDSRSVIAAAVGADAAAFAEEVATFATRYERLLRGDWGRFSELLDSRGETLGLAPAMGSIL